METALDFYRKELSALVSTGKTEFETEQQLFEKAKEIEKEQIEVAYIYGGYYEFFEGIFDIEKTSKKYYNKTYGNERE